MQFLYRVIPSYIAEYFKLTLSESIFSRGNIPMQLDKNCFEAYIGPTVCELEGPIPILKRSNTLIFIFSPYLNLH